MRARLPFLLAGFGVAIACGSNNKFNPTDGGTGNDAPFGFDGFAPVDGNTEGGPPVDKCHVPPDDTGNDAPTCTQPPQPPNSFDPKVKWTWTAPTGSGNFFEGSMVTPLVANFTDDNNDGEVNLCDIPDVIVATGGGPIGATGTIYMLAGDTGRSSTRSINPATSTRA